jgi:leucyl-tRNA synthetase
MGYGTGAIMAVPGHDSRDHRFAKHFGLPVLPVVSGDHDYELEANETYAGTAIKSLFLDGLPMAEAKAKAIDHFEASDQGERTVNYRLRDAIFARQRYWGEPIPIVFDSEGVAEAEEKLPLVLPNVASYTPTGQAESPLAGALEWVETQSGRRETNTMPGWAGSSWYFYRYMDAKNEGEFANREALDYWRQVDLYLGGTEHATGHLLYARFWSHFLHDLGLVPEREPFKRLVNQGMILGQSRFVYRVAGTNRFVSYGLRKAYETTALHVDVSFVNGEVLDIDKFKAWLPEYATAEFELEEGEYRCGMEVEKMSKSKHNVVNPDVVVGQYGADALRLYEMFLGPLEVSKPWDTQGIEGVSRFLGKVWRLFYADDTPLWNEDPASEEALKALHKCVAKVSEDIEKLSFNTVVSALMICVNELTRLKCSNKQALEVLLVCVSPLAPHITEELWKRLGHSGSIAEVPYPIADPAYLKEDEITYPISVNGKVRVQLKISAEASEDEIKQQALTHPVMLELMAGAEPKRVIVVKGRIVNVVL